MSSQDTSTLERLNRFKAEADCYLELLIEKIRLGVPIENILISYRRIQKQYSDFGYTHYGYYGHSDRYDPTDNPYYFKEILLGAPFVPEHYCALYQVIYGDSQSLKYEQSYKSVFINILRDANARNGSSALHQLLQKGDLEALKLIQMVDSADSKLFPLVDDRLIALAHIVAHPAFDPTKYSILRQLFIPKQDEICQASVEAISLLKEALCQRCCRSFDDTFDFIISLQEKNDTEEKKSTALFTQSDVVDIIAPPLLSITGLIDTAWEGCFNNKSKKCGYGLYQAQLQLLYFKSFTMPQTQVVIHARENLFPLIGCYYTTLTPEEWRAGLMLCAQAADLPFFEKIIDQMEDNTLWTNDVHKNVFLALHDPLLCLKNTLDGLQEQQTRKPKNKKNQPIQDELCFRFAAVCWDVKKIQAYADDPTRFRTTVLDATLASMANSIAIEKVKNPADTKIESEHSPERSAKIDCIKLLLSMGARVVTKNTDSLKQFLGRNNCNSVLKKQVFNLLVEAYKTQTQHESAINNLNRFFITSENEEATRILHDHGANDFLKALAKASPATFTFLRQNAQPNPSISFERAALKGFEKSMRFMITEHHLQLITDDPQFVTRNFQRLVEASQVNPDVVTAIWNTMQPMLDKALEQEKSVYTETQQKVSGNNPVSNEMAEELAEKLEEYLINLDFKMAKELIQKFPSIVAFKDYCLFNNSVLCQASVKFLLKENIADVSPRKYAALLRFIAMCDNDLKHDPCRYNSLSCVTEVVRSSDIALRHPNEVWPYIQSMECDKLKREFWKRIKTPLQLLLPSCGCK